MIMVMMIMIMIVIVIMMIIMLLIFNRVKTSKSSNDFLAFISTETLPMSVDEFEFHYMVTYLMMIFPQLKKNHSIQKGGGQFKYLPPVFAAVISIRCVKSEC